MELKFYYQIFFNSEIKNFLNTLFKFVLKGKLVSLNLNNLFMTFSESDINNCFNDNFCSKFICPLSNKQLNI